MYENLVITKDINANRCPFCGKQPCKPEEPKREELLIICPVCGRYVINTYDLEKIEPLKDKIASILYHSEKSDTRIIGDETFYDRNKNDFPRPRFIPLDSVEDLYPSKFSTKIEYMLLDIARKSLFFGDVAEYTYNDFCSAFFIRKFDDKGNPLDNLKVKFQIQKILSYLQLETVNYTEADMTEDFPIHIELNPNGWQRIEALEIADKNNKNVFVAMSFGEEAKATREALKSGITNAGYHPILIDEVTHNHQIVPEMFKKIRDSKFLVIDISIPNMGAYYEAGYAYGLGKEVIFCCNEEAFDSQDKNMRPHFDVSQKQMIRWKDENDLTKQLEQWIKSLFE